MQKSKMILLISAIVMEIVAIILIAKATGAGSSPAIGIVLLVIGLMLLIIGVSNKTGDGGETKN